MTSTKPRLLYICGAAHSGSTLLDVRLGRHPLICSVGEVAVLNEYIENADAACACRIPARDCSFWQSVLHEFASVKMNSASSAHTPSSNSPEPIEVEYSHLYRWDMRRREAVSPTLKLQMALSIAYLLAKKSEDAGNHLRMFAPQIMQRASNMHGLFDAIRKVADVPVILDSSKHAYRYRLLAAERPEQVRCIFLVRDGRARMHSHMRREGVNSKTAANLWVSENKHALQFLKKVPKSNRLDITYEALCRDPDTTLRSIHDFADLPEESTNSGTNNAHISNNSEIHNIGGNRARFIGYDTIREDVKWRDECSPMDLQVFERIGGELNRRLLGEHYRP